MTPAGGHAAGRLTWCAGHSCRWRVVRHGEVTDSMERGGELGRGGCPAGWVLEGRGWPWVFLGESSSFLLRKIVTSTKHKIVNGKEMMEFRDGVEGKSESLDHLRFQPGGSCDSL